MIFHLITFFFLNAVFAAAPLGFRSRIAKIVVVFAAAFGLTNIDFNHLPYSAPGWSSVALPAIGVALFLAAFILEALYRSALSP